jgi:hypothetical protein
MRLGRLNAVAGRIFLRPLEADRGGYPDDGDECGEAEGEMRVLKSKGDGNEVDKERDPVLALDRLVLCFKPARVTQAPADRQTQQKKAEPGNDHRRDVEGNREGVHLLLEDVGGEERQQRETEEKAKVGVEDQFIGILGSMDEVVVVNPVNADESEGDEVESESRKDGPEALDAVLMRDLELKHHDGDDDGDDSVGEGFKSGWGEDMVTHGGRLSLWQKHTTAIRQARACPVL